MPWNLPGAGRGGKMVKTPPPAAFWFHLRDVGDAVPYRGGCGSMGPAACRRRTQSRFQSKNAPGGAFSAYFSVFSAFSSGSGGAQKRPYIVAYLRILAASSGLASPGFMRQRQLPWAVPGTFMRASAPRPR